VKNKEKLASKKALGQIKIKNKRIIY